MSSGRLRIQLTSASVRGLAVGELGCTKNTTRTGGVSVDAIASWAAVRSISNVVSDRPTVTTGIPRVVARMPYIEKVGLATRMDPDPPKQVAISKERISSSDPLPTEILDGCTCFSVETPGAIASFT